MLRETSTMSSKCRDGPMFVGVGFLFFCFFCLFFITVLWHGNEEQPCELISPDKLVPILTLAAWLQGPSLALGSNVHMLSVALVVTGPNVVDIATTHRPHTGTLPLVLAINNSSSSCQTSSRNKRTK